MRDKRVSNHSSRFLVGGKNAASIKAFENFEQEVLEPLMMLRDTHLSAVVRLVNFAGDGVVRLISVRFVDSDD